MLPVEVFIAYAPQDELLCKELEAHLSALMRQGIARLWHDGHAVAGEDLDAQRGSHIATAQLFVVLLSADFLAMDHPGTRKVMARVQAGAPLIRILVRACDWRSAPFSDLAVLPRSGTPITTSPNRDEAWSEVVSGVREAVDRLRAATAMTMPGAPAFPMTAPAFPMTAPAVPAIAPLPPIASSRPPRSRAAQWIAIGAPVALFAAVGGLFLRAGERGTIADDKPAATEVVASTAAPSASQVAPAGPSPSTMAAPPTAIAASPPIEPSSVASMVASVPSHAPPSGLHPGSQTVAATGTPVTKANNPQPLASSSPSGADPSGCAKKKLGQACGASADCCSNRCDRVCVAPSVVAK